jgi:hypothetical protein
MSELRYLAQVLAQVADLGLLEDAGVRQLLGELPEWLQRLQTPGGFAALERELGITIPAALKEFWSRPDLVCAFTVAQLDALGGPPAVEKWTERDRFLTFDIHHHSGCAAAVRLTGADDPPVVLEFEPGKIWSDTFSGYLESGFRQFAFHRDRRAQRMRLQRVVFGDDGHHCLVGFEVEGETITLTLYPSDRPQLETRAEFRFARVTSVHVDDNWANNVFPSYIHDFDAESLGGDRWHYCLSTTAAKYRFEAGWPTIEREIAKP